ncbi:hypothetical protein SARC_02497 [Sphaeroforma arctica JP610]|uniref:ubiquitinyl hydrolase 1 n=1 Tax=Sphaeroforma arctica JP610 TaxID=667725 RepID=A0A0L0G8S3_9EUKA|nr:hypothetical protein SARC_02497 [Sphaeroforma arctica JP610]KNC85314.1 hypothetical protein SARC_02497 [Sphaeroforma arctica JP610]|eukprot:XP_014159216.1 hypothetical protein SARC_02497 [Sphaeroforma arctica JP610]
MTFPQVTQQVEMDVEVGQDSDEYLPDASDGTSSAKDDPLSIADRPTLLLPEDIVEEHCFTFEVDGLFDNPDPNCKIKSRVPEVFSGCEWRFLIFPRGNNNNYEHQSISVFLECAYIDANEGAEWKKSVFFTLALLSVYPEKSHMKDSHHVFQSRDKESDWGFSSFTTISEVQDANNGFSVNNKYTFEARVVIAKGISSIWSTLPGYDSKMATGCVGLKNQGATCYMNSMLQALFFTNKLRKAVYSLPSNETDTSVSLALQRVFFDLQTLDEPVGTTQLTRSFGWNTADAFMQHDVQEFNRVLCDNMESKMKGTDAEGTIASLFEGRMKSYVKCINVDYESSRSESFYDIQLVVKDKQSLYDSFDEYVVEETLDGDNKYLAEGHGLQDAKKGCIFEKLPPVLHLQLRRFEYDIDADAMVKINDRHEFDERINLDKYLHNPGSEPADYTLYSVLVHSGDIHSGHYVAYIKPKIDGSWCKFDDDKVTNVSTEEALDGNFGVDKVNGQIRMGSKGDKTKKFTNAYMLVYIRDSCVNEVMVPVEDDDMRNTLREQLLNERQKDHRKIVDAAEAHKYMMFQIIQDKEIAENHGFHLFSSDTAWTEMKVHKLSTVDDFLAQAGEVFGLEPHQMRFWKFVHRQNGTMRPHAEVLGLEGQGHRRITELENWNALKGSNEKLYMETPREGETALPQVFIHEKRDDRTRHNDDVMIYLKDYDAVKGQLTYIGSCVFPKDELMAAAEPVMRQWAGIPDGVPLVVYEEIKPLRIDMVNTERTFRQGELASGDILTFQVQTRADKHCKWPTVKDYYEYLAHRITITFNCIDESRNEPSIELELRTDMKHDEVAQMLGSLLPLDDGDQVDPATLRFHLPDGEKSSRPVFRGNGEIMLETMIDSMTIDPANANTLLYEYLDVNIVELESKVPLSIWWRSASGEETEQRLLLEHGTTVSNVLEDQRHNPMIKLAPGGSGKLRLLEIYDHRILRVYQENEACEKIRQDDRRARLEEVPLDQLNADNFLNVVHFHREAKKLHGSPFLLAVHEREIVKDLKKRLQAASTATPCEFEKWKVAILDAEGYNSKPKYLKDEDSVQELLSNELYPRIGLDHPGRPSNYRSNDAQAGAVVIRN